MKYVCDYCGKPHDSFESATLCENSHNEEIRREEEREAKNEQINTLIGDYIKEYKRFPDVSITINGDDITISGLFDIDWEEI